MGEAVVVADPAPHRVARAGAAKAVTPKAATAKVPAAPPATGADVDADVAAGKHALLTGAFDEAAAAFGRVTKAASGRAEAWRGLAVAEEKRGRRESALRAYKRYLMLAPSAADRAVIERRVAALEHK